jgi:pimeloyl-ACP methyl ester carboxylesterase
MTDFVSMPVREVTSLGSSEFWSSEYCVRVQTNVDIYVKRIRQEKEALGKLLLLHGAGMDSSGFDLPLAGWSFSRRLAARGWDVFMLDYRGHGRSSRVLDRTLVRVENVVTDSAAVLDAIDGELQDRSTLEAVKGPVRWHVVGESFGSLVAPVLAARLGDRIASITMLGGIYGSLGKFATEIAELSQKLAASPGGYAFTTEEEWEQLFFRDVDPDVLRWHQVNFGTAYAYPVGPYLAASSLPVAFSLQDVVASVQIISGSEDVFLDRDSLSGFLNELPGPRHRHRLIVQDGVGHMPYVERKLEKVVEAIQEFCM